MIKEIKIENFKSIASLNLELGRLNVFIGANGSGKSNILEAIAFGSAASENKLDNFILFNRGMRLPKPELMRSGFEKGNENEGIFIEFKTETENFPFKIDNDNKYNSNWKVHLSKKEDKTDYFTPDLPKCIHDFFIYAPENHFLRRFEDEEKGRILGIRGEGLFPILQLMIKEKPKQFEKIKKYLSLLDWFEDIEMPNDLFFAEKRLQITDNYLRDGAKYFDQKSANEGFLYMLFYFTLFISDYTPQFFAIDNIDNAMNPKMGDELVHLLAKLAKEHDKQVILTTHNPSILDGLDLSDDDQRLFVISRNKKGHTQALRVPHRESDERLSYRFIRGSIGGLPKNF